jgi:hypothetical protein
MGLNCSGCCNEEKRITLLEVPLNSQIHQDGGRFFLPMDAEIESKLNMFSVHIAPSHGLIQEESNEDDDEEECKDKMGDLESNKARRKYSTTPKEHFNSQIAMIDKKKVQESLWEFTRGNSYDMTTKKSRGSISENESTHSILNQAMIHSSTSNSNMGRPDAPNGRSQACGQGAFLF